MKSLRSRCSLWFALVLALSGCAPEHLDEPAPAEDTQVEEIASSEQALLGSAYASAFGMGTATPDYGHGLDGFGRAVAAADMNGDGAADMVVGIPGASNGAGAVDIFWGKNKQGLSFGGLSHSTSQVTHLQRPAAYPGDATGLALAVGDFNCDGHLDVAAGGYGYDGRVDIVYGPGFTTWEPILPLLVGGSVSEFGSVLAAGNFNGDMSGGHGCDDLAVADPLNAAYVTGGSVAVYYGRSTGLNGPGALAAQYWDQNVGSVFGIVEEIDGFGSALAAGDFNSDGKDDLAIGVPYEDYYPGALNVGLVHVLKGSSTGLTSAGNEVLEVSDFSGLSVNDSAGMGSALAAGDFDGDGDDDLAVGADSLPVSGHPGAGGVLVYRQISNALFAKFRFDQDTSGMPGVAEDYDLCGSSLAAGDFDGDGQDDLAFGCRREDVVAGSEDEGAFNIAYFGINTVVAGELWHRNSSGIPGQCTTDDGFGMTLAAGDFNGDGLWDLAAGDNTAEASDMVNVLYAAP